MTRDVHVIALCVLAIAASRPAFAGEAQDLCLVPFPKEVQLSEGSFPVADTLHLQLSRSVKSEAVQMLLDALQKAGAKKPAIVVSKDDGKVFRVSVRQGGAFPKFTFRKDATEEDYVLQVRPDEIVAGSPGDAGLRYAMQTLRQLLRANCTNGALPCLTIRDWPSLRWRAFQDDITRGPSPRMETLKREVELGAYFKLNLFTYYMEYQFAFEKHPVIGPEDGSLTAEELAALVKYAQPLGVDILGNQQSFGHFARILEHDQYAPLRETPSLLCPVKEESYELLDDFYSEVCPLLPFPMFNVCCDETWGLGTGPSKELAEKIGVGGVYVRHLLRVHDLLKQKYGKRMMMWGDIILQHPEHLDKIPKDTVMLTWGYGAKESFESQIVPFAESGYEFFVCPGVSNWSRILPDFGVATVNIRNFVRDGVKHGALGMLNTDWEDDGESLDAPTWYGDAWGAECAWNGSTTSPEDFSRRIGAVLFGESGDHFGRAIERLSETHRLAGMEGMNNRRFWSDDFLPQRAPSAIRASANRLLEIVRPAIEDLEACRKDASQNAGLLDAVLFGARRMEVIGQRMLDGLEVAELYNRAIDLPLSEAVPLLTQAENLVRKNRDAHEALGRQFESLWLREAKPYALDWTMDRYAATVARYDALAVRLADACERAKVGKRLPRPEDLGLALPEEFPRRARPYEVFDVPLDPNTAWHARSATHRLGIVVSAMSANRRELPLEVFVALPAELAEQPMRAFCILPGDGPQEVAVQLEPTEHPARKRLIALLPGPIARGEAAKVFAYLGLSEPAPVLPQAVVTKDGPGGKVWLENDKVRLLLGPEGAHVYRWEVKSCDNRDLTMPGESGWAGFSDMNALRGAAFELKCVARGPALVRYECRESSGLIKTLSLYAGTSWMEVMLNEATGTYWDFDNSKNFAADGPTPGHYVFSSGAIGPVGKQGDGVPAQVKAVAHWGIKYNADRLALGLATPDAAAQHVIAPGAGAGGVGIERSRPTAHFVTYAGVLESDPAETMNRLCATLNLKNPPRITVYALEQRE